MSDTMDKAKILFVDDEINVLHGLRRSLRDMRNEWDMHFCGSGNEALPEMEKTKFDVIVSDVLMPEMDGLELLNIVRKRYPDIIRFVLSGHADAETVCKLVGPAQRFLAKPTDSVELKRSILQSITLKKSLPTEKIRNIIGNSPPLPVISRFYQKIINELNTPSPSIDTITETILEDVAMVVKVFELVCSGFFGETINGQNVRQLVTTFNMKLFECIFKSQENLIELTDDCIEKFKIDEIRKHCFSTADYAEKIAVKQFNSRELANRAAIAGIAHDIGKLVLISTVQDAWEEIIQRSDNENKQPIEIEREILGVDHTEVGAYLLGIKGCPNDIFEAVAFHHTPGKCSSENNEIVKTLHVANILAYKSCGGGNIPEVDSECTDILAMNTPQ